MSGPDVGPPDGVPADDGPADGVPADVGPVEPATRRAAVGYEANVNVVNG